MNEAERLAEILEDEKQPSDKSQLEAAAELRRLVAINAELVEALEKAYLSGFNASGEGYNGEYPF